MGSPLGKETDVTLIGKLNKQIYLILFKNRNTGRTPEGGILPKTKLKNITDFRLFAGNTGNRCYRQEF